VVHESFSMILSNGKSVAAQDLAAVAPLAENEIWTMDRVHVSPAGDAAFVTYWATEASPEGVEGSHVAHCTAVLQRQEGSLSGWVVMAVQKSASVPLSEAPPPFYN
jgi:hypothetical protein